MRVERFKLICRIIAMSWLLVVIPASQVVRTSYDDFSQFYVGAIVARAQRWDALYPVPRPDGSFNPGFESTATPKAALSEIATRHGVFHIPYFFIQPPPVALLLLPLAWLHFDGAHA